VGVGFNPPPSLLEFVRYTNFVIIIIIIIIIIPLTLLIMSERTTDRFFARKGWRVEPWRVHLQQSQRFQNFLGGETPIYVRGETV